MISRSRLTSSAIDSSSLYTGTTMEYFTASTGIPCPYDLNDVAAPAIRCASSSWLPRDCREKTSKLNEPNREPARSGLAMPRNCKEILTCVARSGAACARHQRDTRPGLDGQVALGDDNSGQQPVDRRRDLAKLAAGGGLPLQRHGRAEQDVPAPQPLDGQASLLDDASQPGPRVPAHVPDRVVMCGPERHVAGHRNQSCPARLEDPGHLGRRLVVLVD